MRGRRLAVLLSLTLASTTGVLVAADGTPGRVIQYVQDGLTVRLTRVPVAEVLTEIGRQAGIEIRGELGNLGDTSAEFEAVPLPAALHRLLGEQSFALIYGAGGRLRGIQVLRTSEATNTSAGPVAAGVPPTLPPALDHPNSVATWSNAIAQHPALPISGKLALALGGDRAPFRDVMHAAMRSEDPAVRSAALRASIRALATDSEMRAALVGLWTTWSDADLAKVISALAGDNAEEVLSGLATKSPTRELRSRARAALNELRFPQDDL